MFKGFYYVTKFSNKQNQTKKIIYCLYNISTLELDKVSISVVFSFSDLYLEYMWGW